VDFSLNEDQEALRDGIRSFCESRFGIAELRKVEAGGLDKKSWREFAEMGILGLRIPESAGGVGLGMSEAVLVFEQIGRCVVPGPLLWTHLAEGCMGGSAGPGDVILTGIDVRGDFAGPFMVEHARAADHLVVLRDKGVFRVPCDELEGQGIESPLDPLTPIDRVEMIPQGDQIGDALRSAEMRREGAVLVSAMRLGIAEATQELATAYASEREQFGRAVGSFQALKHILADCFVRQELARAAVYAAGVRLDDSKLEGRERAVSAAVLIAGEAAMKNARACIQVHGGMGFTWENPAHYYLKRAWVLENAIGSSAEFAESLAQMIVAES
jgi:alkylation response protein AidB-like acyl-CoA dehydrogenase